MAPFSSELVVVIPATLCKAFSKHRPIFPRIPALIDANSLSACTVPPRNPKSQQQFNFSDPQSPDISRNPSRASGARTLCVVRLVFQQQTGSSVWLQLVAALGGRSHACFHHNTGLGHLDSARKSFAKTTSTTTTYFRGDLAPTLASFGRSNMDSLQSTFQKIMKNPMIPTTYAATMAPFFDDRIP